jgi:hypothetical protein
MKIFDKIVENNKIIKKSQAEVKEKKENFNKEWDKWGKKKKIMRRIP